MSDHIFENDGSHQDGLIEQLRSAEETLTELQTWLEKRLRRLKGLEDKYNPGPQRSPFWWGSRIKEVEETLDWLETRRSGND